MKSDITNILMEMENGDAAAAERLLPIVYEELRRLAAWRLASEKPGQTLQATALVHEAYLRLVVPDPERRWNGRSHFIAAAAEAMRRILINRARDKGTLKRGGGFHRVDLDAVDVTIDDNGFDLLSIDEALTRLAQEAPDCAQLVKLRFFAGLSQAESAEVLGISPKTAARNWNYARAWLIHAIEGSDRSATWADNSSHPEVMEPGGASR